MGETRNAQGILAGKSLGRKPLRILTWKRITIGLIQEKCRDGNWCRIVTNGRPWYWESKVFELYLHMHIFFSQLNKYHHKPDCTL
jgi:hypothetical protein